MLNEQQSRLKEESMNRRRVTSNSKYIGQYLIRVSKILTLKQSTRLCNSLNVMVRKRTGRRTTFKVMHYKQSYCNFIVARKVELFDLQIAIEHDIFFYHGNNSK